MLRKNDNIKVVDKKDGKLYDCKVVKRRNGRVLIHYIGWAKTYDEWLSINDSRIKQPHACASLSRAHSEDSETLHVSRVSAEILIDETHDKLFSSQPSASTLPTLSTPKSPSNSRKRVRDPDSGGSGGNLRKRGAYADAAMRGLLENDPSPQHRQSSTVAASVGGSTEEQQRLPSALPASALEPPEAIVSSAGSGGGADGGESAVVPGGFENCGLCRLPTELAKVECTDCKEKFHGEPLCLGVKPEVCAVLLADTDGAVLYRCCSCRLKRPNDPAGLSQLTNIVGELVRAVRTEKVHCRPAPTQAEAQQAPSSRDTILAQVREVREREKRRDCIVIRGFRNMSVDVLRDQMAVICDLLDIQPVVMTDVQVIGDSNYFRARVTDADNRKELLLRCHQLRNSEEFSRVYINRDLTFQQRQDLRNRRTVARQSSSGVATGSNVVPVSQGTGSRAISSGRFACLADESQQSNDAVQQSTSFNRGNVQLRRPRGQSFSSLQRGQSSTRGHLPSGGRGSGGTGSRGQVGRGGAGQFIGRGRGPGRFGRTVPPLGQVDNCSNHSAGSNPAVNLGRGRGRGQSGAARSEEGPSSRGGRNSQTSINAAMGENSQDFYRNPVPSTSGIQFNNVPHQRRSLNM